MSLSLFSTKNVASFLIFHKSVQFSVIEDFKHFVGKHMGLDATKPVFRVSDKVRLKPVSSAAETSLKFRYYYTPRKLCLWWGYCFHVVRACVRVCVHPCVRPSVTLCFHNIFKSHCWIFIKPCKHVHICKTNTLDKKVRAKGQFYFPL